jgi:hypothetical protein
MNMLTNTDELFILLFKAYHNFELSLIYLLKGEIYLMKALNLKYIMEFGHFLIFCKQ